MDINKIKAKLAEHNAQKEKQSTNTGSTDNLFWKPSKGTQKIRIVPSPHNPDFPGTELFFYYKFKKPVLAPVTFGLPDPVVKFCNQLKSEKGEREVVSQNWKIAGELSPKKRVFVPIIVRGEDGQPDTGPFYWGMAPTYYDEVLKLYADDDYGDISDFERGRDLTVEFVPAVKEGAYPETFIRPRGNSSKTTDDPAMFEKIKSIKNIVDVYKCPTEEELTEMLKEHLQGNSAKTENVEPKQVDTKKVSEIADEFSKKFADVFSKPVDAGDDMPF